jgi:hypothetical protein
MAVSWYTPTISRFSDPTKHARILYTLLPLISENPEFTYRQKQFKRIHAHTKKWAKGQIIAGVKGYNAYHAELKKHLNKLQGKKVVFLPGSTIDNAVSNPKILCLDYACERNRLTEEILLGIRELKEEYNWDMHNDVHFIQVSPVVLPFHATPDNKLVHSLEDESCVMGTANLASMLGNTTRDLLNENFTEGILQYSLGIFESETAKEAQGKGIAKKIDKMRRGKRLFRKDLDDLIRLFGKDENLAEVTKDNIDALLSKSCAYNQQLMAEAYATVCKEAGIQQIVFYGPRTSVELNILKSSAKLLKIPVDSWGDPNAKDKRYKGKGTMKNAGITILSAADYKAIKRLKGRLYNWFEQKLGKEPEKIGTTALFKQHIPKSSLPKPCPALPFYRCPNAGDKLDEQETGEKPVQRCVCDFARNRFTIDDVAEMLREKTKRNDPEAANKLYEELQFKKVKCLSEKGNAFTANELDILAEDMRDQGWTFTDIQEDLRLLSQKDAFISMLSKKGIFLTRSWQKFLGDQRTYERLGIKRPSYKIEPLLVRQRHPEYWSTRPSEFSSRCYVARMLSKIDKSKLPEQILNHIWSVAGTARHRLALWKPWKDYNGRTEPPVSAFTERELFTTFTNDEPEGDELVNVNVFGHADALAVLRNGSACDDIPVIFDYKRSPNEKPSYTVQEMLYKCGCEESSQRPFEKGGILVIANRPHFADPDERKFPVYHIVYCGKDGEHTIEFIDRNPFLKKDVPVKGLKNLVLRNYKIQHQMLDPKVYLSVRENECSEGGVCFEEKRPGVCSHPFNQQLCRVVADLIQKGEPIQKYFLEGVRL